MGVAAGAVSIAENAHQFLGADFKAMSTLLGELKAEDFEVEKLGEAAREIQEKSTYQKFEGADLVAIRELMDQLADRAPKWGGLLSDACRAAARGAGSGERIVEFRAGADGYAPGAGARRARCRRLGGGTHRDGGGRAAAA